MTPKFFYNALLGKPEKYTLRQQIFNGGTFSSMVICILITIGDTLHEIGNASAYFTLIPAAVFAILFWFGKSKGANSISIALFVVAGLSGIAYDWFFFYGLTGSSLYIAMLVSALIPALFEGKIRVLMVTSVYAFLSLLFIIEFLEVYDPGQYPTHKDHISDLFMTACFMIMGMLILVSLIIGSYEQQKQITIALNNKLQEHNQGLQQNIELKNRFFSIISHDLRGPVGALNGLSNMLEEETNVSQGNSQETTEIVSSMRVSSKQTLQLLDNLLHWARAESGELKPENESCQLEEIVDSNFNLFNSAIRLKKLKVTCNYNSNYNVHADKTMTDLIVRNLLSNAIKFTPEEGVITVSTYEIEDKVCLTIADSGVGINDKQLAEIFKIDNRTSTRGTNKEKGTGLGLKLCKQFIELIGGDINVVSKVGEGSQFNIYLNKGLIKQD
jgi:signal transduction histidine kinase